MTLPDGSDSTGAKALVARASHQQGRLSRMLQELGVTPVEVPLLAIEEPADGGAGLTDLARDLRAGTIAAVSLTSPNGAAALATVLAGDARTVLADVFVACVGPGTARHTREALGVEPDLVASVHTTVGLGRDFPPAARFDVAAGQPTPVVALARADIASPQLPAILSDKGWAVRDVDAYRTCLVTDLDEDVLAELSSGAIAVVAAGSPSTIDALVAALDGAPLGARLASIGPVTSARARDHDLVVTTEADTHDLPGLVAAVRSALGDDSD